LEEVGGSFYRWHEASCGPIIHGIAASRLSIRTDLDSWRRLIPRGGGELTYEAEAVRWGP
jgi:hypothetical protein